MKKAVPVIVALSLIFLIILGVLGYQVIEKYMPTKDPADLFEVYGVNKGEAAIYYGYERLDDVIGICENGQTYLPLSWVSQNLNSRFYWDSAEKL